MATSGRTRRGFEGRDSEGAHLWQVQILAGLGGFLAAINNAIMAVALPTVAEHFHASAGAASWIVLSYMLVTTVLVFVFGRVADMLGRRRMFLGGLAILAAGGLLAGLAPTVTVLICCLCVEGVGAAALLCNITALITDAFPPARLANALGINATIAALAQVLGPVLGGVLTTGLGWRAVFWFNVPIALIGLVWGRLRLRPTPAQARGESFDFPGAILSMLGIGGLILALSEGGTVGWTSLPVLIGLALFVLCLPAFLVLQSRRRHPLLDLSLFTDRARSLAYLSLFLMAMAYYAVVLLMSLYLQAVAGKSADEAGFHVLYVAVGMAVASPVAGRLRARFSTRALASTGLGATAAGLFALALLIEPRIGELWLGTCLLVIGAGVGLFMTPNTSSVMSSVNPERRGIANGVRQTVQNAGWTLSTALSLMIVTMSLPGPLKHAAYAGTVGTLDPRTLDGLTTGYHWALLILGTICILGLIASLARTRDQEST
ncbi:MFS transporter [Sciscionella sediminilitoris]|uniref:MFS transporter n=1 Tax=Sciscionella sediminilitoris TaxID=1445613 RepID=UPI00068D7E68|nr:MFS transporter [Sciscionella sp. SE31]